MNLVLFRKLMEKRLLGLNSTVAVEYGIYEDCEKIKSVKGIYTITKIFINPLLLNTQLEVTNSTETVIVDPIDIKLIEGLPPIKLAAQHGIRPDGKDDDAPKRRGRKPKVRVVDPEFDEDDFIESRDDTSYEEDEVNG